MDVINFMRSNRDYFEDFVTRSTYHSNAIEGSTLTRGETYALLWNDNSMTVKTTPREFYEAVNHKAAFALACGGLEEPLSERLIKDINRAINKDINDYAGYRTVGVVILGMDYVPPEANQVPQLMMQIVHRYQHDERDPFEREADFHIHFEHVHPFGDGNGRTGRILINRGLLRDGIAPAVVSVDDKAQYIELIDGWDTSGLAAMLRELSEAEAERIEIFRQPREQERVPRRHEEVRGDCERTAEGARAGAGVGDPSVIPSSSVTFAQLAEADAKQPRVKNEEARGGTARGNGRGR